MALLMRLADEAHASPRDGADQALLLPLSPTARRAALIRLAMADSETIRPYQTASSIAAHDALAVANRVEQEIEGLRLDRIEMS
jgi:hypothetical protein